MNPYHLFRRRAFTLMLAASALGLAGCNLLPEAQPDNARHYVLETVAAPSDAKPAEIKIGLRPVEIPAYLRQKTIVTRAGDNELTYAPSARWAEPLEAGITRVLRERLATRVGVLPYPFPTQLPRDFDLTVRVLNAEGTRDGVRFVAVFELLRVGDKPEVVVRREFRASGQSWNGDYGQLARALSVAASELADEIAKSASAR